MCSIILEYHAILQIEEAKTTQGLKAYLSLKYCTTGEPVFYWKDKS